MRINDISRAWLLTHAIAMVMLAAVSQIRLRTGARENVCFSTAKTPFVQQMPVKIVKICFCISHRFLIVFELRSIGGEIYSFRHWSLAA